MFMVNQIDSYAKTLREEDKEIGNVKNSLY